MLGEKVRNAGRFSTIERVENLSHLIYWDKYYDIGTWQTVKISQLGDKVLRWETVCCNYLPIQIYYLLHMEVSAKAEVLKWASEENLRSQSREVTRL